MWNKLICLQHLNMYWFELKYARFRIWQIEQNWQALQEAEEAVDKCYIDTSSPNLSMQILKDWNIVQI